MVQDWKAVVVSHVVVGLGHGMTASIWSFFLQTDCFLHQAGYAQGYSLKLILAPEETPSRAHRRR